LNANDVTDNCSMLFIVEMPSVAHTCALEECVLAIFKLIND